MSKIKCDSCNRLFATRYSLRRHMQRFHSEEVMSDADNESTSTDTATDVSETSTTTTPEANERNSESELIYTVDESEETSDADNESTITNTATDVSETSTTTTTEMCGGISGSELSDTDHESEEMEDDHETSQPIIRSLVDDVYQKYAEKNNDLIADLIQQGHERSGARRIAYKILLKKYRKTLRKGFEKLLLRCRKIRKEPLYRAIVRMAQDLEVNEGYDRDESIKAAVANRRFKLYAEFPSDMEDSDNADDESEYES